MDTTGTGSVDAAPTPAGDVRRLAELIRADLQACADRRPGLFADPSLKPVPARVALAVAAGAPWHTAAELAAAARTSLWIFAVDLLVDTEARRAGQVADVLRRCAAAADGGPVPEGDELAAFLAELRADLVPAPSFAHLEPVWREELDRMLRAMAREWSWKARLGRLGPAADHSSLPDAGGELPTGIDDYLAIADNFGSTWVNVAHWIANGDPAVLEHLEPLREGSRVVQSALRLLNDLATSDREASWGDINVFAFGTGQDEVRARIGELADEARRRLEPLRPACPQGVRYLLRQLDFSLDYYGRGRDYWGRRPEPAPGS